MSNLKEKFSLIYDQHIEKIYRFVYLKVNSQEVAEDITSKVFLKGWEAFQNEKEILNPSAFLYQIARNSVFDHYRQKGRIKLVSTDRISEVVDSNANIHEKAVLGEDIRAVKASIQNLKKDYQDVLIWHYLDDMPIGQIAQILTKPEGTVRVMIHRGLKALKEQLQVKEV